jgi:excisionase family DNA binding protein
MKPAYRTLPDDWLTVAESAQLLGISKVSVYKAINCGRLEYRTIEGRKCIERRDLKTRYWGSSQRFADRPLHALASPIAALSDADLAAAMAPIDRWIESQREDPDWERVAELVTEYLGPTWPAPPWDGEQAATVAMALSLAQEAV